MATRSLLHRSGLIVACAAGLLLFGAPAVAPAGAAAQKVYSTTFEKGAGPQWSRRTVQVTPVGARHYLGDFGKVGVKLSLASLPAHRSVTVSFDLFIMSSWDGDNPVDGPDVVALTPDAGPDVFRASFSNDDKPYDPAYPQSYPDRFGIGIEHPGLTGAIEKGTLGFGCGCGYGGVGDSVYRITVNFAHMSAKLLLRFAGTAQLDGTTEWWGLDNVAVSVS